MGREEARIIEKQETHARAVNDDEHHCILCEGVIEYSDHEVFFLTGYCRHCTEALEE
jgi:hypothetical protein